MFERRLKLLLIFMLLISAALAARAAQLQWLQHDQWRAKAASHMETTETTQTTRGTIYDRHGNKLAFDAPCIDAAVDYAAITEEPDPAFVSNRARRNLAGRLGKQWYKAQNAPQLLDEESAHVRQQISDMWAMLADISHQSPEQIDDVRRVIVAKVERQRRAIGWRDYRQEQAADSNQNWYQKVLSDAPTANAGDQLHATQEPYVILQNIDSTTQAYLLHQQESFFALTLIPGKYREYPMSRVACHVIGYLHQVGPDQILSNPLFGDNPLKFYKAGDLVGATGLEAMCETTLRGTRGQISRVNGVEDPAKDIDPVAGADVHSTLDGALQAEIEDAFVKQRTYDYVGEDPETRADQHGAAVVEKINTGEILAMVSNPGFDLKTINDDLPRLAREDLDLPLFNRATQMAEEPGSTVKTIVGSGAITHGYMTPESRVVCHGELVLDDKVMPAPHCWIYPLSQKNYPNSIPSHNLLSGTQDLPGDALTIADGLERSCNVCFETIADKMGMNELCFWFDQFGLGRPTGIGIEESPGRLFQPGKDDRHVAVRPLTWNIGIGEGVIKATPLQMVNVAATIARGGIWMRPRLIDSQPIDRVDLHLSPDAISTVQLGMFRVVNGTDGSGTGILPKNQNPRLEDDPLNAIHIAGKTGTAQSSILSRNLRDADGALVLNAAGQPTFERIPVGYPGTEMWYKSRDNHYDHAWYIGYAPAEHPQVAFCVMVQFGGSGGKVAGSIAHDVLEACSRHGYLLAPNEPDAQTLAH